jgi:S-adenosylmethionine:tRNA ribosyltransferase-isomerase
VKTEDFNFELPESLIAQYPTGVRGESRLFVLDRSARFGPKNPPYTHSTIPEIAKYLEPGTLMVFNDSRVRKARIYGFAEDTGAKVEFLLIATSTVDQFAPLSASEWRVMCTKTKRQRIGRRYLFPDGLIGTIAAEAGDEKILSFDRPIGDEYLEKNGHVPLPPYIRRDDEPLDSDRYQTVYARVTGSAACPTAGLHFTANVLEKIRASGVEMAWITLHVGLGTFLPVRSDTVEEHVMHEETFQISEKTATAVNKAKREGRKVLAVGTTSLRALESAWGGNGLAAGMFSTRIFIYPGYEFKAVDQLFTNFHTPKSTLLILVSAFAGRESILDAYREAIFREYRFFSYGDAMLIL